MSGTGPDDLDRLGALWREGGASNAAPLLARIARERRKQMLLLAAEGLVCAGGIGVGVWLIAAGADAVERMLGGLALLYAAFGAGITQWSRTALVRRLVRPVQTCVGDARDDARLVRRLVAGGWAILGAAVAFVAVVVAMHGPSRYASGTGLAVLVAAVLFIAAAAWSHWRFARRRAGELEGILALHRELEGGE